MKLAFLLLILLNPMFGRAVYSNWCQQGNKTITTAGVTSATTTPVQRSYPTCTITVFESNGSTIATIYSTSGGAFHDNPFTLSGSQGLYQFFADQGNYVVRTANTGLTTFTFNIFIPFDGSSSGFISSLNGLTTTTQTFAVGTAGVDFTISSSTSVHTFNIPSASASNRGLLTAADWTSFNARQTALTFTAPLTNTFGTVALTVPITIADGGHGQTTAIAGFNALAPTTTAGDTMYFNGTNNTRLGIGAANRCYTSTGSAPQWAVCPSTAPDGTTGAVQFNNSSAFGSDVTNFVWDNSAKTLKTKKNLTVDNCSSSAAPAVCAAAPAGSAVIAASATTVVVNSTAVTANSQIFVTVDESLGTKLSVTCNTQGLTVLGAPRVSARSAATSFTVKIDVGPTTNPLCFSYYILN